ncbi:MAG: TRAP transporter small permease [Alphaproteobacteria bacterium]|nr:TRAP transporter small permease [Alphaproteobacteria bacterium]MCW5742106.1 TRAP transporter small permease [Alphaproteobacteria bacterium]
MASSSGEETEGTAKAPSVGARLYNALGYIGGVILAVMTVAVFTQVVLRYLGLTGVDGIEEIPRYLFVWLVMIGGAAAMWRNEHTTLDYFQNLLPPTPRALLVALVNAAGVVLFAYLIHLSMTLVPNAGYQTSSGLGLTLDYVFAAIPFGAAFMIPPMLRNIYFALRTVWRKRF